MLPKIEAPTYSITLPVSKTKLTFRPFLVKEQKILLMAMESQDEETVETNVRQILQNCAVSEIDIDLLPMVDVEFYFLNLRAKSIGELVETKYKCENTVDDKVCNNPLVVKFNALDVDITIPENNDVIPLTDTIGVKMKYPNFSVIEKMKKTDSLTDIAFELIRECIEYVYDNDVFYYSHETPKEELNSFLDSLTQEQFKKVEEFIDNLPSIQKTIDIKCSKCGFDHKIVLKDLNSFFQ